MISTLLLPMLAAVVTLPLKLEQPQLDMLFFPRSPDQMTAFYTARKFPRAMIDILAEQCFITVGIHNKSEGKVWMKLEDWQFTHEGKPLSRKNRRYWLDRWAGMNMPQSKISTFRWTLIPEQLDYLPGEEEGGNIILPRVSGPITLTASFKTGDDQSGPPITIRYEQLFCAENAE